MPKVKRSSKRFNVIIEVTNKTITEEEYYEGLKILAELLAEKLYKEFLDQPQTEAKAA